MKRLTLPLLTLLLVNAPLAAAAAVELETIAEGLTAPIDLADPDDGSGRLFVVEQQGIVHVLTSDGQLSEQPLLDLRPQLLELKDDFEERGLLGFALHPDFAANGRLYVSYAAPLREGAPKGWDYTRRISELTLAPDVERVNPSTERTLIELDWPSRKHNGGVLAFGPDGFLYIGLGDGGGAHGVGEEVIWSAFEVLEDQLYWDRLAQDTTSLFGSIHRIDVDGGFPGYGIPDDNPFVGKPGLNEIYAFGFRNPYRIAFDKNGSGDLLATAIAETLWEAIYLIDGFETSVHVRLSHPWFLGTIRHASWSPPVLEFCRSLLSDVRPALAETAGSRFDDGTMNMKGGLNALTPDMTCEWAKNVSRRLSDRPGQDLQSRR